MSKKTINEGILDDAKQEILAFHDMYVDGDSFDEVKVRYLLNNLATAVDYILNVLRSY